MPRYPHNLLAALSQLLNALAGGSHRDTLCAVIGRSVRDGGAWARLPLPSWFRAHCLWSCGE